MNKHYSTLPNALLFCVIWLLGSNQVSANPPSLVDSVDVEISLSNPASTPIYTSYSMELMVTNTGNQTATGVEIKFGKPTTGVTYLGGNEYVATQGTFNPYNGEVWYVGDVLPNDTQTIQVNYYLLQDSIPISYAQVIALNEDDTDSTPNNGTPPSVNEDDEASTAPPTNGPIICTGDVIFESQAEVDAFSGCSIIDGNLFIRSPYGIDGASSDITDLSPLSSVIEVRGEISIDNNDQLIDLHGLENVTTINTSLVIRNCENLNSVQALSGFSGELNYLVIWNNQSLTNIDGLNGITSINNGLSIVENTVLQNLNGLSNLSEVNGTDLLLSKNLSLTDIQGLSNLTHVNTDLIIVNCDALENLQGLNNLTTAGSFILSSNDVLNDVSAVTSLTHVDHTFFVGLNPMLSDCCIFEDLLKSNTIGGTITIEDNAPGCNSEQDIESSCGPVICTGDLVFESQAEVDAFSGCAILDGQLSISGADITDLTPLASLKEITKALVIQSNSNLASLDGLNNLTSIGGLVLIDNPLIQNLMPFSNVSGIEWGVLILRSNHTLIDLTGLEGFFEVSYLSIYDNNNLKTLEGLDKLTIVSGDVSIQGNPALENLNGLNSLHTVQEVFGINSNATLTDISALAQLNSAFVMAIGSNPSLTNLSGLENLHDLWTLAIVRNDALQNLDVFSSLTSITGDLTIIENPVLTDCCGIQPLLNGGSIGGKILIEDNPFACGSGLDIVNNCDPSGVDLELSMSQPNTAPAQWTIYPVTLTLRNTGDSPATGIVVHFPKPDGVVYAGGNEFTTSQGTFNPFGNQEWVVGKLKAGGTVTLTVNYFLLQSGAPVAYAQVSAVNEEDIDSSPNNGTPPSVNEDDEANSVDPTVSSACSGDIVLKSQAEVNAFGNCEIIDGYLAIAGEDITDLTPLYSLKEVKGNLNIWNNSNLTNLEGLNNLTSVGSLTIRSNPLLESLSPLSNLSGDKLEFIFLKENESLLNLVGLEGITGVDQLLIEKNSSLQTLNGLDNLNISRGDFIISENPSLLTLAALSSLQTVKEIFRINKNDGLINLQGLEGITSANSLQIIQNANIQTLEGLNNLTFVENRLDVTDNPLLQNLNGLDNLVSVGTIFGVQRNATLTDISSLSKLNSSRDLVIFYNHSLTNLNGLENLSQLVNLTISNNIVLTDCCSIQPLLSSGNIGGTINIGANPSPCSNQSNILNNCITTVCNGNVYLESQAEVDAFQGCDIIEGILLINGADIIDLSPLSTVKEIIGSLKIISNSSLTSLNGLNNLKKIGGLLIFDNPLLESLIPLGNIQGDNLEFVNIYLNQSLLNLQGLEGIKCTNDITSIQNNSNLQSLKGLENLRTVRDRLVIQDNPSLINLDVLENLDSVYSYFSIQNNYSLNDISGLNNFHYGNYITISGNFQLKTIQGFKNIPELYSLIISNNSNLSNLDAFSGLISINQISIDKNPLLADCCIFNDLLNSNGISGSISINNNAPGCNSEQDIELSCGPVICTGDVILESQAEVDAFPGCEIIEGSLIIQGPGGATTISSDIHDLSPLLSLTEVHGRVISVKNDSLYDLNGLNALTSVGGGLAIVGCTNLTSIQALSGISGEIGNISILGNTSLVNLDGLEGINKVKRNLSVENNAALQNLDGLSNVDSVSTLGNFFPLYIYRNPSLENIQGLQGLEHIGGPMVIVGCDTLENLNGLENLKTVGGFFVLAENYQLYDASALGNLSSVGGSFTMSGNPLLSDCCIFTDLINNNGINGSIDIQSNAPGCNSEQDIDSSCGPVICNGDLFLSSQAEVDAFGNCQIIDGNLTIEGADITDLSPLQSLEEITGILRILYDSSLTTLTGLQNLKKVYRLFIYRNPLLESINSLGNVTDDALNSLVVEDCPLLQSLHGLEGITGCDHIHLDNNDALLDLSGLQNLAICRGDFQIGDHALLENVNGLGNLQEITGTFNIVGNVALTDLSALSNLKTITDRLIVVSNHFLTSLNGLHNLQTLNGLNLTLNDRIEQVDALSNITSMNDLFVRANASLSNCCGLYPLLSSNGVSNLLQIYDNPLGCNDVQDIVASCSSQGVDLELSITTYNLNPAIYTSSPVTLTLSNMGTEPATGVKVSFPKPDGTVYTGGNEWTATQGTFNPFTNEEWTVGDLPAGGSVTLTVSYFLLTANALSPYAQVIAYNETDSDSSPGNGTPPTVNEDDEATILLNGFTGNGGGISLKNHNERFRLLFDNIFPNPAKYLITMDIFSRLDQTVLLDFYDVTGRSIHRMEVQLEEGQNEVELNVSEWRSGTYNVIGRGDGLPAYGRFLKIWEE